MKDTLEAVMAGHDLSEAEAASVMQGPGDGRNTPAVGGALLAALRTKGESSAEVGGFAKAMRDSRCPSRCRPVVRRSSTPAVPVAMAQASICRPPRRWWLRPPRGPRRQAETARSPVEQEVPMSRDHGYSHPPWSSDVYCAATRLRLLVRAQLPPGDEHIMPIRRAMGVRTVFNVLGPLSNPARPLPGGRCVLPGGRGDHGPCVERYGRPAGLRRSRCGGLGRGHATGAFHLADVRPGEVDGTVRDPQDAGIERCNAADLAGGDAAYNARALEAFSRVGRVRIRTRCVWLRTGARGLWAGGRSSWGIAQARAALVDGRAAALLAKLRAS